MPTWWSRSRSSGKSSDRALICATPKIALMCPTSTARFDTSTITGIFRAIDDESCEVDFFVDFEFRSRTLQALIGVVFNQAMQQIVNAFERRAEELYGSGNKLA